MSYSNIKRVLSVALLLAFAAPSATTLSAFAYSTSDASLYGGSMVLTGDVRLTNKNDQITLSLRDSDVKQVLRMFADKAGMNIVFHDSVNGKVTLDLVKTPINEAFSLVLQIAGLNYYKQGNTMIVISKNHADNAVFSKQEMYTFPINYVSATKVANFLNKNVFAMRKAGISGVQAATVNSATNELIVFGMPGDVAIVQKVIEQFDREPLSKTFTVSHTTPAQMADMICNVLLPSQGHGGSDDNADDDDSSSDSSYDSAETGAAAGVMTGAAADASGGGEGGEGGGGSEMKLGEGIVACTSTVSKVGGNISPFSVPGITIAYFPQRGTITMMGGSEAQANLVANFIKTHDVKQPQAFLELSIVELTESGSKAFQNQWNVTTKAWQFGFDGHSTSGGRMGGPGGNMINKTYYTWSDGTPAGGQPKPIIKPGSEDSPGEVEFPTWLEIPYKVLAPNTTYVQWAMNYLIENKKARVLANPKILITNGQQSIIDLTQDYIEKVDTEFLSSTSAGYGTTTGAVNREYTIAEDLGIKVVLTPFISPEGFVTLNIVPDYSTIQSQIFDSEGLPAVTLLSRRNLDLKNVRIKDGETLVLGGMIQEAENKTTAKIPFLGDLPIIGAAFRSTSTSKEKSELVIMITPHIINDGDGTVVNNNL